MVGWAGFWFVGGRGNPLCSYHFLKLMALTILGGKVGKKSLAHPTIKYLKTRASVSVKIYEPIAFPD